MAQTLIEKLLARASNRELVSPGEIVEARIDVAMIHEGTGPLTIRAFQETGLKKLWDPSRVVVILDHMVPASTEVVAALHRMLRRFARDFQVGTFYEAGEGICHQVLPEKGHALPGTVVVGTDSHTCTYGAFGCFATGIGSTEMAGVFATGRLWFRVPETLKIVLSGSLPPGVVSKDVALYVIGRLGVEGANYKAVEFCGPVIDALDMDARMVFTNMTIEMGGKAGLMVPDEKTLAYLRPRVERIPEVIRPDPDARYEKVFDFDLSRLQPQVACPHSVDNVKDVSEVAGTAVDQAFLGSCTNGHLDDLRQAAGILEGKKIAPGVRMIVIPASREIYLAASRAGYLDTFVRSGAIVANSNCGPCCGSHEGILAEGEVCVSSTNRNFKGRMGKGGAIYLASPAVVAASAVAGKIVDPRSL